MNLIIDRTEIKGRSLKPADTGLEAEKALREAVVTGQVGILGVDPQYLVVRTPRGKHWGSKAQFHNLQLTFNQSLTYPK